MPTVSRSTAGANTDHSGVSPGSYAAFQTFLASVFLPAPGPNARALDLGCGGGQAALMLARRGYTAFGVDYSETAIGLAQRNAEAAGVTICLSVGDCLSLDGFASSCMDVVVDNHVLHCLVEQQDRQAFLRSAYRVLKPGGIVFSDTGSCEGAFDPQAVDADPETCITRSYTRYYVKQAELNRELQATGFHVLFQALNQRGSREGAMIVTYAKRPPG